MTSSLKFLFEASSQTQSEWEMRSQIAPKIGEYFTATRQGIFFFDLQISELVALGRTNAEIGSELWITENSVKQALKRMFRKLEVSSRAEMVAQLASFRSYGTSTNF